MKNGKMLRGLAALSALIALAGCDTVKSLAESAVGGQQPQETFDEGVKRPPLTLPPDYNLRPPASQAGDTTDFTAAQQGRQAVFGLDQEKAPGAGVQRRAGLSVGESAFLQHAGASAGNGEIRAKIDQESTKLGRNEKVFTDKLLNPASAQPAESAQPAADSSWFGRIFGTDKKPTIVRKNDGGLF